MEKLKQNSETIIILVLSIIFFSIHYLFKDDFEKLIWINQGIVFGCLLIYLCSIYKIFIKFINDYSFILIIVGGVIFLLARIFAEKVLNQEFEIDSEYLNNGSMVLALFYSIEIWLFFFGSWLFIKGIYFVTRNRGPVKGMLTLFSSVGLLSIILYMEVGSSFTRKTSVFADAHTISSSCSKEEVSNVIWYLEKDESHCYKFDFSGGFSSGIDNRELIKKVSK